MGSDDFFREIAHARVIWGERTIMVPLFYRDVRSLSTVWLASADGLQALLPSPRMHPIRFTPGQSILSVTALEYNDCDIGPYNEVSISIPFTLDRRTPLFTGLLRKAPAETNVFVRHLPVTTEIARAAGAEFAGYPKFLADILFEDRDNWVVCRLSHGEQLILELKPARQNRMHLWTERNGRLLRSESIVGPRSIGVSGNRADGMLELGSHAIAEELGGLRIGRLLAYTYTPHFQMILTQVLEGLDA